MRTISPTTIKTWNLKAGDIIGTSGQGIVSGIINLGTLALPGYGLSHVAIVSALKDDKVFFESTSVLPDEPANACIITGQCIKGVQCHHLSHLATRPGKVWVYHLKRKLLPTESASLTKYLKAQIGKPYDMIGALGATGGKLRSAIRQHLFRHDCSTIFCSELVGDGVNTFYPDEIVNSSVWSPNSIMRYLVCDGIYDTATRLL